MAPRMRRRSMWQRGRAACRTSASASLSFRVSTRWRSSSASARSTSSSTTASTTRISPPIDPREFLRIRTHPPPRDDAPVREGRSQDAALQEPPPRGRHLLREYHRDAAPFHPDRELVILHDRDLEEAAALEEHRAGDE